MDLLAQALLNVVNLPKPELVTFDGNAKNWAAFMRTFKTGVADKIADPATKLTYLIQYCSGEAKKTIKDCVMLPPAQGFTEAMALLKKRYGSSHTIARSYIDDLTKGARV